MTTVSFSYSESRKVFTVSEVTRDIRGLLEDSFSSVWISGEISNCKVAASGHIYFTLKDETAQLSAVMFKGFSQKLLFQLENGLEVIVHGRISVYELRGQFQIIVDYAEPKGLGALQLAFDQLKKKLEVEGLFDQSRKRPIPFFPSKVGIITSSKGAVLHDIKNVIGRRFSNMDLVVYPVLVQGEGAKEEIVTAIEWMNTRDDIDVLIVGRGGGSMEDLWAFNEECVVRAIFNSRIPVISAVGHETDFTLADFVADLRAPTPSAAAELAVPEKEGLFLNVQQAKSSLIFAMGQILKIHEEKTNFLKKQLKDPVRLLEDYRLKLDDLQGHLKLLVDHLLVIKGHHLREIELKLDALSPLAPLRRGYGLVFSESGSMIKSVSQAKQDDELRVKLFDGELIARVLPPLQKGD